jgi:hypothetical protein
VLAEDSRRINLLLLTCFSLPPPLVRSGPIARQAGDRALPPKMQQDLLQDVLTMAQKRGEAGLTAKHLESYAFDGKKNIFTPVKLAFEDHTFTMDLPARNGGGGRRMFQVSDESKHRQ